ncbi:MAG: mucoidy inhibitor MuiA family protein [Acidobacteriota bacterium]
MKNIRKKNLFCWAAAFLLCFSFMQAQEIPADSKIKEVTLFPDRATIEREASLTLSPGTQKIILSGLPSSLIPDSIRVSGEGQVKVKILGVELQTEFLESASQEEIQKLEKEIASVKQEIARLNEAIDIQLAKEKFLKSIGEGAFSQLGKESLSGSPDPLNLEKVLKFLETNLDQAKTDKLSLENIRHEKEEKLKALQKKLESIQPERSRQTTKAEVLLEAENKGDFTLFMNYMVRNARWTPHYTLRALPEDSSVELTLAADIQQKSGENWNSVTLNLSTSSPSFGASPPQLPPWEVDIYEPQPLLREKTEARKG